LSDLREFRGARISTRSAGREVRSPAVAAIVAAIGESGEMDELWPSRQVWRKAVGSRDPAFWAVLGGNL